MTVHFIGAGPGAADLITVRGQNLVRTCPVCLYAGSLVPDEIVAQAPPNTRLINTAQMKLPEIISEMAAAHQAGLDVARLHSGDISLYSAVAEQMRRLDGLRIPYEIVPGVPAFAAAAAAIKQELTLPGINQSLIITRTAQNSSPMPEGEGLEKLTASKATLALHLSAKNAAAIVEALVPLYGADCPAIIAARVSWPDEVIIRTKLAKLESQMTAHQINRTAIIFIGTALEAHTFRDSKLYA